VIPPAFDTFLAIDWSGARSPYRGIAVAKCMRGKSAPQLVSSTVNARWTRTEIANWLCDELKRGRRMLIGMDFAFGFPFEAKVGYFHGGNDRQETVFDLWKFIDDSSGDEPDFGCDAFTCDPRFEALFWKSGRLPEGWVARKRRTELACAETTNTRPETVYKLIGSKQVGKASLTGIRVLHYVRRIRKAEVSFWPFENSRGSTITEIYPTLFRKAATGSLAKLRSVRDLSKALAAFGSEAMPRITPKLSDHETDALISAAGLRCLAGKRATWWHSELASEQVQREGWIFGVAPNDCMSRKPF
jgi:hypothetical protein